MRHTEYANTSQEPENKSFFTINDYPESKHEIPLILAEYEHIIKDEFASDEEDQDFIDIEIDFCPENDINESPRKNKRKALTPQRSIQSASNENSSESSQDPILHDFSDSEIPEGEDLLRDIDEENIFKGIRDEADGEKLDEELLDNVKEEWRAHWGIKCNMCEQIFSFKSEYDVHYRNTYNIAPVYTCSFCDKTVDKYSSFRSHCYRHITEGRYKCAECTKGFSLQSLLHVHIVAKHTRAKPFTCEECGKCFVTKPGLKIHSKKHKNEIKEDYPCAECGKVLHTRGGLTSHMNVHRLGRRFMCDVCGKTFTQKVNMQQHVKQHTGDKPHECDKCDKTFAEKSHLARHYSFHSEQRPFKCDVCQKMYKTERCLKVHSMVHAKERPYICTICNKGFLSSTKLKQHCNIHTGERPYACKYCERKFTNYPNWLKHTRRRHNVDHKTGEDLPPKQVPKAKTSKSPSMTQSPTYATQSPIYATQSPAFAIQSPIQSSTLPSIQDTLLASQAVIDMQLPGCDLNLKLESPQLQLPEIITPDLLPQIDQNEILSHDNLITDFTLSKTEELLLQQGLFNFPIADDKFHGDYFQMQSGSSQINDFIPMQFIQQLPCD